MTPFYKKPWPVSGLATMLRWNHGKETRREKSTVATEHPEIPSGRSADISRRPGCIAHSYLRKEIFHSSYIRTFFQRGTQFVLMEQIFNLWLRSLWKMFHKNVNFWKCFNITQILRLSFIWRSDACKKLQCHVLRDEIKLKCHWT